MDTDTNTDILRRYARNLRKNSTDAERHLWYFLRAKRIGVKFKRQVPIGRFIVDFVCLERKLIIELDGGQHQTNQSYDIQRTSALNQAGFQVLRFWNNDILRDINSILALIHEALSPTLSRENSLVFQSIFCRGRGGRTDCAT